MTAQTEYTLINPQTRAIAFSAQFFDDGKEFTQLKNYPYYCMVLASGGEGTFKADVSEYSFSADGLFCFSVYQPFQIRPQAALKGVWIKFHPDFFCIHKHQEEVACNGILFNNAYDSPWVRLDPADTGALLNLVDSLRKEMQDPAIAQYELLISYLKIFLINATRIKLKQIAAFQPEPDKQPFILKTLKDAIEENFKTKHSPSAYAEILHISTKALNRLSKTHFSKTLTELIAERIVIEAKRELYLTDKPVKTIAYDLGFDDEFYFSRFFKNNATVSPQVYRQTVGFDRGR